MTCESNPAVEQVSQPTQDEALLALAVEVLGCDLVQRIEALSSGDDLDWPTLLDLDTEMDGPSIRRVTTNQRGNYDIADREVFRPLQYCDMYLQPDRDGDTRLWLMRGVVQMSGLHLESLVKHIAIVPRLPLGACLRHPLVKARVDAHLREQLAGFALIYNEAKHDVSHEKDTHRFSLGDAVLAYFVARKLAMPLYPMARIGSEKVWQDPS